MPRWTSGFSIAKRAGILMRWFRKLGTIRRAALWQRHRHPKSLPSRPVSRTPWSRTLEHLESRDVAGSLLNLGAFELFGYDSFLLTAVPHSPPEQERAIQEEPRSAAASRPPQVDPFGPAGAPAPPPARSVAIGPADHAPLNPVHFDDSLTPLREPSTRVDGGSPPGDRPSGSGGGAGAPSSSPGDHSSAPVSSAGDAGDLSGGSTGSQPAPTRSAGANPLPLPSAATNGPGGQPAQAPNAPTAQALESPLSGAASTAGAAPSTAPAGAGGSVQPAAASGAQPVATLTAPAQALIGEPFTFTVSFKNTSTTQAGYQPYVDVILPAAGADGATSSPNGITFVSASAFGSNLTYNSSAANQVVTTTFNAAGVAQHPFAHDATGKPLSVTGTPGYQLVSVLLPVDAVSPAEPAIPVTVTALVSNAAEQGYALNVQARAGFARGNDPADDPATDPVIQQPAYQTASVTPTAVLVTTSVVSGAPQGKLATGPDYPVQVTVSAHIATGQTFSNLTLSANLPNNLQFVQVNSASAQGSSSSVTPVAVPSTTTPGGTISEQFSNVVASSGPTSAQFTFTAYAPRLTATGQNVLDPVSGADATATITSGASGIWNPIDPRHGTAVPVSLTGSPLNLTLQPYVLQQGVTVYTERPGSASGPTPGDTLERTLTIQLSDYFSLSGLVLTDLVPDGESIDPTFTPTMAVAAPGFTLAAGAMAAADYTLTPANGTTRLDVRVGNEIVQRGRPTGNLLGGLVKSDGTGYLSTGSASTVSVRFHTIIQPSYTSAYPPPNNNVKEGDTLSAAGSAVGSILSNASFLPTGNTSSDQAGAAVTVPQSVLNVSVYAVNGNTTLPTTVTAADTVTYRLQYQVATDNAAAVSLTDYLPRVFSAGSVATLNYAAASSNIPAAGTISAGPSDTFRALYPSVTPTLSSNTANGENSFSVSFGNLADASNRPAVIDLLFTVQVGTGPEPDGLPVSNWVRSSETNSAGAAFTSDQIARIVLSEPVVRITKGAVGAINPRATFSGPTGPSGVTWAAPGSPATTAPFTGALSSDKLATQQVNSNVANVDAGDLVRFVIVLENTGQGSKGAFAVQFSDAFPSGFAVPSGGLNLSVVNGAGTAIAYTDLGGGLFGSGLQLTDSTTGALRAGKSSTGAVVTSGLNVAVITYDLVAVDGVNPQQSGTSSATLLGYEAAPGGANFATLSAPATATILAPTITRTLTASNQSFTTGSNLAVGEIATYTTVITVPEGVSPSAVLTESLPAGLAIVSLQSLTASSAALSTSVSGGFSQVLSAAQQSLASPGQSFSLNFGTLTNTDRNNSVTDTITLTSQVVVLDVSSNQAGTQLTSTDSWNWSNPAGAQSVSAPSAATVVVPQLSVSVSASPSTGQAGTAATFTITVRNGSTNSSRANNVTLSGVIDPRLINITNLTSSGTVLPDSGSYAINSNALSATFAAIDPGQSCVLTFTGTLAISVAAAEVVPTTATVKWTSLPGATPAALSGYNAASYQRTGNATDPGGAANNFVATATGSITALQPVVTVALASTSQASTTGSNVVIGEKAQYLITLAVPEGTTPSFSLTDALPAGLALVSFDGWTASSFLQTSVAGGFSSVFASPTIGSQGSSISFNFGTLTNTDPNTADTNTITALVTAVVLNAPANVAGAVLTDTATANYTTLDGSGNAVARSASGAASVTVVEPKLTVSVSSSLPLADATDTVTYTITVTNPSGATANTAFDAAFSDALPAGLTNLSPVTVSNLAPDAGSLQVTSTSITANWSSFPVGQSSTFTFTGTIAASQLPGSTVADTATVQWTSLPGPTPTPLSTYNTATSYERTGNTSNPGGAANTYTATASGGATLSSGTLEGYVYEDGLLSRQWSASDPGVAGVTVTLTGTDHLGNSVSKTTTTSGTGRYAFPALRPGTYTITKTPPAGWLEGPAQVGAPALGAAAVSNDQLGTYTVPRRTNTLSDGNNFAEYLYSVSGTVWDDANWNGARDAGETPVAGVTLTLQSSAGYSVTAVTASDGTYSFPVAPGTYTVTETVPAGDSTTTATARTVIVGGASVSGQDFGVDLTQWVVGQTGGSASGKGTGTQSGTSLVLNEGDSFQVYAYKNFIVPNNAGQLSLTYSNLVFDPAPAGVIKDAFEIALLNPSTGQPLLVPYTTGRDAAFNLSEGQAPVTGAGTTFNGNTITLDLSGLAPGTPARLYVKLLNDHGSTHSTVTLLNANLAIGASPRFFVSDGTSGTYRYTSTGGFAGRTVQPAQVQTGVAASPDGSREWTVTASGLVTVYDSRGTQLGNWAAGGATAVGDIAVLNSDLWVVDVGTGTLRRYANAYSLNGTGQTVAATATYPLAATNTDPTGLAANGTTLWVTDGRTDQVFVYSTSGALLGSWALDPADSAPTGITTTPGAANDLWVVDHARGAVYHYTGGAGWLNNGGQTNRLASDSFPLAAGNTDPEGIADPPAVQTNAGTDFWLTYPETSQSNSQYRDINSLYITGAPNTTVTVTVPATGYSNVAVIPSTGYLTISDLPPQARWNIVPFISTSTGPKLIKASSTAGTAANYSAGTATAVGAGAARITPLDSGGTFQYVTADHEILANFGVHVSATSNVSVTVLDYQGAASDSFLALPTVALGTDYLVSSYVDTTPATGGGAIPRSGTLFEIVGTQNNTQVTIVPTAGTTPVDGLQPNVPRNAGVPYTITLNQGDVYGLLNSELYTSGFADFTGTVIHSTHPVAVIGGNGLTDVKNGLAANSLSEELWPTQDWGTNYFTVPLATRAGGDVVRVLAGTNNTQVTFTNSQTQTVTLNRGQYYEIVLTSPTNITSTFPVAVVQYGASNSYPYGATNQPSTGDYPDPTMTQIVSSDRYLSTYTFAGPNAATDPASYVTDFAVGYANLVVRTSDISNVRVDGSAVAASAFTPVGSSGYSAAAVTLTPLSSTNGSHTITSLTGTPFGLTVYEDGNYDSASNPGGLVLAAPPTIQIDYPANPSSYPAGQSLVISGTATAVFAGVPISYVTVNGVPVDALDSSGHFFQKVTLAQGDNTYHFVAYDTSGAWASVDLVVTGTRVSSSINTSQLVAASSVVPVYQRTSLNNATHALYADFNLQNTGAYPVTGPVLVEIAQISDPSVSVLAPDGVAADGNPYYNLTRLITNDTLDAAGGAHPSSGTATLAFSVPNGGQFTYHMIVLAQVNQPPRFTSEPNLTVSTGGTYTYTPTTFDPQNEPVTVTLTGGPAGMTFANGQVVWPVTVPAGAYAIELTATDTQGGTARQRYTISVQAPLKLGPVFDSPPNTNAVVGQPYSYQPVVADPDGLPVTYSVTNLPAGASFNTSTGALTWTPAAGQAGTTSVTITASDSYASVPQTFAISVASPPGDHPPYIVSNYAPTASANAQYLYQVRAVDADNDTLTYGLTNVTGGLSINSQTGLLTWSTPATGPATASATIVVSDGRGLTGTQAITVTVPPAVPATVSGTVTNDVNNQPASGWVVFLDPSPTAARSTTDPFTLTAANGTYSLSTTLTGQEYVRLEPQSGFQIDPATATSYTLTVTAGASFTNKNFAVRPLTQPPSTPVLSTPPNATITAGQTYTYTATATDPDSVTLYYSLPVKPAGLSIDPLTGIMQWAPVDADVGTYSVTLQVSDHRGGAATATYTLTVAPAPKAPVVTSTAPGAATATQPYTFTVSSVDPQGLALTYTLLAPSPGALNATTGAFTWTPPAGLAGTTQTVTVQVSNSAGVASIATYSIPVQPATTPDQPPVFGAQPRTLIEVGQPYEYFYNATSPQNNPLTDALTGTLPAGLTFNAAAGSLTGVPTTPGSYPLVATVTDGRGGSATLPFTLVVTAAAPVVPVPVPPPVPPVAGVPPVPPPPPQPSPVDQPPRITSTPPAGGRVGVPYSYFATASNPQNNVLHWQLTSGPVGAVIDPVTGHVVYTPPPAALDQTVSLTLRVFDDFGGSDIQPVTLSITGNHPPVIVSVPPGATQGQPFVYAVHAVDVDNDPLTYSLAAPVLQAGQIDPVAEGAAINATTGVITWVPQTTGSYVFNIRVSDGQGGVVPQAFVIAPAPAATPVHHYPQIRSSPGPVAVAGSPYRYQVSAIDPDGNALTYSVTDSSGQMSISSSGLISWTPTSANVGQSERVTITVSDAYLSATQTYPVTVKAADVPPHLTPATYTVIEGQVLDADLTATDSNPGDSLTYSFASAPPPGLTLDGTTGHLHWAVPYKSVTANTNYTVQVTATDGAGNADTETETITVQYDTSTPVVLLTQSGGGLVNQPILLQVTASDPVPISSLTLATGTGTAIPLRANGTGTYTPSATGTFTFTATAVDANGNTGTQTITVTVVSPPPPVASLPVVTLAAVAGTVTQPTALSGTVATTTTSGNVTGWTLEYSSDGTNWFTEARATGLNLSGTTTITPTFDPTTLANGTYTLRLSAVAAAGGTSAYAYTRVTVGGALKIGDLTLAVTDLTVTAAGLPITIGRIYDSLNAGTQQDFGYGWRLSLGGYTISVDRSTLDEFGGFQTGSRLYLTSTDGTTEGYTFRPYRNQSFIYDYVPYFAPDPSDTDTVVVDGTDLLESPDGGQTFLTATGFSYDLSQVGTFDVHLPGSSGIVYQVNAQTLQTVDVYDRRGNQLVFDSNDIRVQRRDASGNYNDVYLPDGTQEMVTFARDGLGRITSVTDLRGHSVLYTYDTNGNLASVTDRTGRLTAAYGYNGPVPHFLTSVTDATGTRALAATYDSTTHRVSTVQDATNATAAVGYTFAAPGSTATERATQTTTTATTDPITGVITTSTVTKGFDANGNVIRSVDAAGLTTTATYNAQNLPLVVTAPNNQVTTTTYDPTTLQPLSVTTPTTRTIFSYDPTTGEPISAMDGDGNTTYSTYDPTTGNLLSSTSAAGVTSAFTYDTDGDQLSSTRAGVTTRSTYNASGELLTSTDGAGNVTTYSYDDNGNQTGTSRVWVDPNNPNHTQTLTTSTVYDNDDRAVQTTDAQGLATRTIYDARGNAAQTIDAHGNVTTTVYDARNHPIEVDNPDGTITRTLYDSGGTAVYTSDAYVPGTTAGTLRGSETVRDAAGRTTDDKRLQGLHIKVTIDPMTGIGTASIDSSSTWSVLSDDRTVYRASDGQVDHTVSASGAYSYPQYDATGRQTGTVAASTALTFPLTAGEMPAVLQAASVTHFDAAGRATSVTDPTGMTTLTQYDGDGHVTQVTAPDGSFTQTVYNRYGQKVSDTDAAGNTTTYGYDTRGRLQIVTQAAVLNPVTMTLTHPVTTYSYDNFGNQISIQDANGHTTLFTYDAFGHQLTRTLPSVAGANGTETTTYNNYGDVDTHTDFDDNVTKYIYDYEQGGGTKLGRLMEIDYTAAGTSSVQTSVKYQYDALGRQYQVTETTGTNAPRVTTTTYDAEGRVTQVSSPEGTINYAYSDLTGQKTKEWTGQSEVDYGYDPRGRLLTVTEVKRAGAVLAAPTVSTYAYDPNTGNTLSLTITSGATTLATTTYGYDPQRHWLTSVVNRDGSGNLLSSFVYTRRVDGQILTDTEQVQQPNGGGLSPSAQAVYTYDALDRLTGEAYTTTATGQSYTIQYTLDPVGNRLSEVVTGAGAKSVTDAYNARDELTSAQATASGTTTTTVFGYDANGSQTTITTGGALQQTEVYDARGRLVQVLNGSGAVQETILYTAAGDRAAVTQGGATTSYIVDEQSPTGYSEVVEEYQGGNLTNSYVYGSGLDPISQNTSTGGTGLGSVLLLSDGHSGVRQAVQAGGAELLVQRFDAFGNTVSTLKATGTPFSTVIGYRGQRFDAVLGQYDMRARMYDPTSGRFTAMDPAAGTYADPLQLMRYGYAGANPVANSDPSGQDLLGVTVGLLGGLYLRGADVLAQATPALYAATQLSFRVFLWSTLSLAFANVLGIGNDDWTVQVLRTVQELSLVGVLIGTATIEFSAALPRPIIVSGSRQSNPVLRGGPYQVEPTPGSRFAQPGSPARPNLPITPVRVGEVGPPEQRARIDNWIDTMRAQGAVPRLGQQQTRPNGTAAGPNLPDLQFELPGGRAYNMPNGYTVRVPYGQTAKVNVDFDSSHNGRSLEHVARNLGSDPTSIQVVEILHVGANAGLWESLIFLSRNF